MSPDEPIHRTVSIAAKPFRETPHREAPLDETIVAGDLPPFAAARPDIERIGAYRVRAKLGEGAYGIVYRAEDDLLGRSVAIKVAKLERFPTEADQRAFLHEAKIVAGLKHPRIAPVYHVDRLPDGRCYVVMELLTGDTLAARLAHERPPPAQAVDWLIDIAEALGCAHKSGLVHRDVKPANILFDDEGRAYVADFGLAIDERALAAHRGELAGTAAYMAPEQVRGETHRLDGRTDLWAVGVILYELLAGRRPFLAETIVALHAEILDREVRPCRQVNPRAPKELDRICLRLLAKRMSERYASAADLVEELQDWKRTEASAVAGSALPQANVAPATVGSNASDSLGLVHVTPKGLRSFDAADADFFLALVPGPRDRHGLPVSLKFWKRALEPRSDVDSAEEPFPVGLLIGPSGCGKSSLVRAGLLPRIASETIAIYLEAAASDLEPRLSAALRKRFPELPAGETLAESFAELRRGRSLPAGARLVVVLDQFEQWLHGRSTLESEPLVQALRQCDGDRVQCLLMVRDDFWLASKRLFDAIEVRLVDGWNTATVDTFEPNHARKVLAHFGRAYGRLAEGSPRAGDETTKFIALAADDLEQDGRVLPARLALFAEMVKERPWTPATLAVVGGAKGVGVAFLEESFGRAAPPEHRHHAAGARAVLAALLPKAGADIKGGVRSRDELLAAAGYENRPPAFDDLLRILDGRLKLITPAEQEPSGEGDEAPAPAYQLTHDFLVGSVREWLTRHQKQTRRGRARLCLAERAALWSEKREARRLPSLWETLRIGALTRSRDWTDTERRTMAAAARRHALRVAAACALLLLLGAGVWWRIASDREHVARLERANDAKRADDLVQAVLSAPPEALPFAAARLEPLASHAAPLLRRAGDDASLEPVQRLHALFALAALGEVETERLISSIAEAPAGECGNFVAALQAPREESLHALAQASRQARRENRLVAQVRMATIAAHLGDLGPLRMLCELGAYPETRYAFIDGYPAWRGDLLELAKATASLANDDPANASLRSALALAVGSIPHERTTSQTRSAWIECWRSWRDKDIDPGVHSAADWALRAWKAPSELPPAAVGASADNSPVAARRWRVNSIGLTMLKIQPGEFDRRELLPNYEYRQRVKVTKAYWLADREVSVGQYEAFINDPNYSIREKPRQSEGVNREVSPTPDHPANRIDWLEATLFCNWLSHKEGLTPCYVYEKKKVMTKPQKVEVPVFAWNRQANGYRLPTEAEWEHACLAGASGDDWFSRDDHLLSKFATYQTRTSSPCMAKMPNPWGLFEMQGNISEWCNDWHGHFVDFPTIDPIGVVEPTGDCIIRGGCFATTLRWIGVERRGWQVTTDGNDNTGFRVARSVE